MIRDDLKKTSSLLYVYMWFGLVCSCTYWFRASAGCEYQHKLKGGPSKGKKSISMWTRLEYILGSNLVARIPVELCRVGIGMPYTYLAL